MADEKKAFVKEKPVLHIGGLRRGFYHGGNGEGKHFNNRYNNREIKPNATIEQLKKDGFYSDVFGGKYCFFIDKLPKENLDKLAESLGIEVSAKEGTLELSNTGNILDELQSSDGWIAGFTISEDGKNISKKVEESIKLYRSFDDPEKENAFSAYGKAKISVDFSKLNLDRDPEYDSVRYPYGIFFFSDDKNFRNAFNASCVLNHDRVENQKYPSPVKPIYDWTCAELDGTFKSKGHFVIFYVSDDDPSEDGPNNLKYPTVTVYDIEVFANRKPGGLIDSIGYGDVTVSKYGTMGILQDDPFGSVIKIVIDKIFAKHLVQSTPAIHFMRNYIYLVGDNPRFYDLSTVKEAPEDHDKRSKKGKKGSIESTDEVSKSEKLQKKTKGSKSPKKGGKKTSSGPIPVPKDESENTDENLMLEVAANTEAPETDGVEVPAKEE